MYKLGKRLLISIAIIGLISAGTYAAIVSFSDDDPIQYMTINQTQSPPAGAILSLWVADTNVNTFDNIGSPVFGTEITINKGATTNLTNNVLTVAHTGSYWLYTQYSLYVPDLDSTLTGPTSDTVLITVTEPVMPSGESINVILDKN